MSKAVISLTTIPTRLSLEDESGIKLCINSLTNQSYADYEIHFNIPYTNKSTNEEYNIPTWLTEYRNIKIFRTEDLGPATKLVPTVKRISNGDTIIVVVDDDLEYHPEMLQAQIDNQHKWAEAIIGYDGLRSRDEHGNFASFFKDSRDYYFTSQKFSSKVDIIQHYKTVSYKRRYFEDDFFEFIQKNYSWSDDLLISAYFAFKKRDRIVETHPLIPTLQTNEEWSTMGGALTFPVIRHTNHGYLEGCNEFRDKKIDDNGKVLFQFLDKGYLN